MALGGWTSGLGQGGWKPPPLVFAECGWKPPPLVFGGLLLAGEGHGYFVEAEAEDGQGGGCGPASDGVARASENEVADVCVGVSGCECDPYCADWFFF